MASYETLDEIETPIPVSRGIEYIERPIMSYAAIARSESYQTAQGSYSRFTQVQGNYEHH